MDTVMRFLCAGIVLVYLTACDNNNDSSEPQDAKGIWNGTYQTSGRSINVESQISSDGSTYVYFHNGQAFYGTTTVDGNQIEMQGNLYRSTGTAPAIFNGKISSASSISGSFLSNFMEQGNIALSYNDLYDRSSSLNKLEGIWIGEENYSTLGVAQTWSMTIGNNGHFAATLNGACLVEGDFSTIDETRNEYNVGLSVDCGGAYSVNGNYTGIATTSDSSFTDDSISMVVYNTENLIIVNPQKQ